MADQRFVFYQPWTDASTGRAFPAGPVWFKDSDAAIVLRALAALAGEVTPYAFQPAAAGALAGVTSLNGHAPSAIGLDLLAAADAAAVRALAGVTAPSAIGDIAGATSINGTSPHEAGRNILVNGGFDVWQRGASVATSLGYTVDQWLALRIGGSGSITVSQQALAAASGVHGDPAYAMRVDGSALSGATEWRVYNYAEDVRRLGGATVTLSFWAKASSGTPSINAYLDQYFGSGGSSTVHGAANTFVLSTTWTRYTATVTLASVAGKTIGAGSSTGLRISSSTTALIDFAAVKLERGAVATPYVSPDPAHELTRCLRYFERIGAEPSHHFGVAVGLSTTLAYLPFSFTRKRISPVITTSAASTFEFYSGSYPATTISVDAITTHAARAIMTAASGLNGRDALDVRGGSTAYINVSAEI